MRCRQGTNPGSRGKEPDPPRRVWISVPKVLQPKPSDAVVALAGRAHHVAVPAVLALASFDIQGGRR